MAIEQTAGMRQLQGILDRGFVDDAQFGGQGARREIKNKDDLQNWISRQAYEGRLPWSQQDLYNFFIAPGEQQQMRDAEARYRQMASQVGDTSGQQSAMMSRRLGVAGTGLGRRLAEAGIAGARGSSRFGEGLSRTLADTSKQIASNRGRLGFLDEVAASHDAGAKGRGDAIQAGGSTVGAGLGALASAIGAASVGPQGVVTGPLAAILAAIAAGSTAVGSAAGAGAKADYIKSAGEKLMEYRRPKVKMAEFEAAGGPVGSADRQLNVGGSNEMALRDLFGPFDTDEQQPGNYLYG